MFSTRTELSSTEVLHPAHPEWLEVPQVRITRLWNGKPATSEYGENWSNSTEVKSLWNASHLIFHFLCSFSELNVSPELGQGGPIDRLWEFDVAEAFIRPSGFEEYFEFEVSPLGQWLDVRIIRPRVDVDFRWQSCLEVDVQLDRDSMIWTACLAVPFSSMQGSAVGQVERVRTGDIWRANFFRAAGSPIAREHLSWRPTLTPEPDFHVPAAFGNLIFVDPS